MVVVQHYFEKKRAMASGIAVAGSGAGTLAFGFITEILIARLGWRTTLLVEAAIVLVVGVTCGLLFRPLAAGRGSRGGNVTTTTTSSSSEESESLLGRGTERKTCNDKTDGSERAVFTKFLDHSQEISPTNYGTMPSDVPSEQKSSTGGESSNNKLNTFTSILKNPIFLIYSCTMLLFCVGYHVPYTFTPERAEAAFNFTSSQSSLLVSIMGLSNVGGRLVFGWIADWNAAVRFGMFGTVLFLNGLSTALVFLYTTYPLMVAYSVMFGAFSGM